MTKHLSRAALLALSTALWLPAMTSTAAADCLPDPAMDGDTVTCAVDDTDGFTDDSLDMITFNVNAGVTVSASGHAVEVDDDLTATNNGTIESTGDHALVADKRATITNSGTIASTAKDAIKLGDDGEIINSGAINGDDEAITGEDDLTITNTGTITAGDKGIDTEGFDALTLTNTGTITAADKGVRAGADDDGNGGNDLMLTNDAGASIIAGDEGVETGDNATISNAGTITSTGDDAIQLGDNASITNAAGAEITSTGGDGIDIDSGTITNHGTISTTAAGEGGIDMDDGTAFGLTITNTGTISGAVGVLADPNNTQSQSITNSGLLAGFEGFAVDLGQGGDTLSLLDGSAVVGGGLFGSGDDMLTLGGTVYDFSAMGIMDGGENTGDLDVVSFGFDFSDVIGLFATGAVVTLDVDVSGDAFAISLTNWEEFRFADQTLTDAQLFSLVPAVPLPAGMALLLTGIGGLTLARRRR